MKRSSHKSARRSKASRSDRADRVAPWALLPAGLPGIPSARFVAWTCFALAFLCVILMVCTSPIYVMELMDSLSEGGSHGTYFLPLRMPCVLMLALALSLIVTGIVVSTFPLHRKYRRGDTLVGRLAVDQAVDLPQEDTAQGSYAGRASQSHYARHIDSDEVAVIRR